jgi:hypothetical protein
VKKLMRKSKKITKNYHKSGDFCVEIKVHYAQLFALWANCHYAHRAKWA